MKSFLVSKGFAITLLLFILAFTGVVGFAQEALTEVYITEDESAAFLYPEGWTVKVEDMGLIGLSNNAEALDADVPDEDSLIVAFNPPSLMPDDTQDLTGALTTALGMLTGQTDIEVEEMQLDGREAVVADLDLEGVSGQGYAIRFSDETIGVVIAGTGGDFADYADTVKAIIATFDVYNPEIHTVAPAGEACTVSVDSAGAAALRVGPGFNRTELSSLIPDESFTVLGEAEADDGSLWWKLDKDEALPKSAAAEIWVNQDDVVAAGDCAGIGAAAAPPVIPITAPQPTAVTSSGDTSSEVTAPVSPVTASGKGLYISLPDWHNQLPANLKASSSDSAKFLAGVNVQFVSLEKREYVRRGTGEKKEFHRYRIDYDVTITVRETGQQIARQTFQGGNPPPFQSSLSLSATLNGDPPDFANALPWFQAIAGQ